MDDTETTIFEVDEDRYTRFVSILNSDNPRIHIPYDSIFGTYFDLDNDA